MPLLRRAEPFDDRGWVFELKYDGFRALARVDGGATELVSRRDLTYRQFDVLAAAIAAEVKAGAAVLDGEIVKLDDRGHSVFRDLMRRRGPFQYVAFDLLALEGEDLRGLPLAERKRRLRAIVPKRSKAVLYASFVAERGREFFDLVCRQDLEGMVAKLKKAPYNPALTTWMKVKNPKYSQARNRRELFRARHVRAPR